VPPMPEIRTTVGDVEGVVGMVSTACMRYEPTSMSREERWLMLKSLKACLVDTMLRTMVKKGQLSM
jgi:hypothetical protein